MGGCIPIPGAVFDFATQAWPGTIPFGAAPGDYPVVGPDGYLGKLALDGPRNRAYAIAYGVTLGSVGNLGGLGSASSYHLRELNPTTFAVVTSDRRLAIATAPQYAQ